MFDKEKAWTWISLLNYCLIFKVNFFHTNRSYFVFHLIFQPYKKLNTLQNFSIFLIILDYYFLNCLSESLPVNHP